MPQDFDDQYDDQTDDQDTDSGADRNPLRAEIRRLERANKALKEKAAAGEKAARDLEFVKAGVPLDDPKAKWFLKGYDGDLTAEAIKAAAVEAGLVEAPEDTDAAPADEQRAHSAMNSAVTSGATAGNADAFDQAIAEAKAAGKTNVVIALKQQQAAARRAEQK